MNSLDVTGQSQPQGKFYRLFDWAIACDFALPGIVQTGQAPPDVQVTLGQGLPDDTGFDWFHAWRESDGEELLACARQQHEQNARRYLLRFPGLADFVIEGASLDHVSCHPYPGCREDTLRHLLLDQVIPRLYAQHGHLVLHASAVKLLDGRVIAFIGESGWGKSTLAAALQQRGASLLSDDSVSLHSVEGRVQLIPSYCGLRLNDDSIGALKLGTQSWTSVAHYSEKRRFTPVLPTDGACTWLDSLYVLEEPSAEARLAIQNMAGATLVPTLIKQSFLLDINDRESAARQLNEVGEVIRRIPRLYRLAFARDYHQLPALCDALMQVSEQ